MFTPNSKLAALDLERLTWAWRTVIGRHPMLRAIIQPDGQQRILAEVPLFSIAFADHSEAPPADAEAAALTVRAADVPSGAAQRSLAIVRSKGHARICGRLAVCT